MSQYTGTSRLVRDVLGADAIGAYLHGSAVQGGLRPHSDIDVLVVARRRTTAQERRALTTMMARAQAIYLGHTEERWDDLLPRVRPYVHHVVGEIERLSARHGEDETTPTPNPCPQPSRHQTETGDK